MYGLLLGILGVYLRKFIHKWITIVRQRGDSSMREEPVKISAWIPKTLKELMSRYVKQDTHLNESDFIRDAIREKIQRDAPHLFSELFKTETVEQKETRRTKVSSKTSLAG